jgi:hypothetical protein
MKTDQEDVNAAISVGHEIIKAKLVIAINAVKERMESTAEAAQKILKPLGGVAIKSNWTKLEE